MQLNLIPETCELALQTQARTEVWEKLDDEERAAVVLVLARLMAKAVAQEEEDDE